MSNNTIKTIKLTEISAFSNQGFTCNDVFSCVSLNIEPPSQTDMTINIPGDISAPQSIYCNAIKALDQALPLERVKILLESTLVPMLKTLIEKYVAKDIVVHILLPSLSSPQSDILNEKSVKGMLVRLFPGIERIKLIFTSLGTSVLKIVEQQVKAFENDLEHDVLVICGVDSLINTNNFQTLVQKHQLRTDSNECGQSPSEAAICLCWEKTVEVVNSLVEFSQVNQSDSMQTVIDQTLQSTPVNIDSVVLIHTQTYDDVLAWHDVSQSVWNKPLTMSYTASGVQEVKLFEVIGETGVTNALLAIAYAAGRLDYPFYNSNGVMLIENQHLLSTTCIVTKNLNIIKE